MPIRKSISAAGKRVARQSALKLFTDRNFERELLVHFFERLSRIHWVHDVRPEKPILSIWGVGGIGKTKLLEKATEELGQKLAGLRLISLDLDHDRPLNFLSVPPPAPGNLLDFSRHNITVLNRGATKWVALTPEGLSESLERIP